MRWANTQPWTRDELAILSRLYPEGGSDAVMAALPHRSRASIHARVQRLNLGRAHRKPHESHHPDPALDDQIRRAYQQGRGGPKGLAVRLGLEYGWLKYRASQLGCIPIRTCRRYWEPAEDEILQETIEWGLQRVQKKLLAAGYHRSQNAISDRRYHLRILTAEAPPGVLTAPELARKLGLCSTTVLRWCRLKGLVHYHDALHSPNIKDGHKTFIKEKDFRRWVRDNPTALDLGKIFHVAWFMELLLGPPKD